MMALRALAHPWTTWFASLKPKSKKTRQEDYPTLILRKGEDYDCMTHSMVMQFRRQAGFRGFKVRCQIRDGGDAIEVMIAKENVKESKKG